MVMFSHCPGCGHADTISVNKDVNLVDPKTKFEQDVKCSDCGTEYTISVKLKVKTKPEPKVVEHKKVTDVYKVIQKSNLGEGDTFTPAEFIGHVCPGCIDSYTTDMPRTYEHYQLLNPDDLKSFVCLACGAECEVE